MSRRVDSPDTDADREIHACITATPSQPFVVRAGAGSGKTTSTAKLARWLSKNQHKPMMVSVPPLPNRS